MSTFLFVLSFSVYLITLAPTISIPDSPELVATAFTLGVAHPPGYAIYLILGKFFSFLPLGNVAWRLNLMSGIFASLTTLVVYHSVRRITGLLERGHYENDARARLGNGKGRGVAAFCAALLAFSPAFWSFVISAEIYHVNLFLLSVLIFSCLVYIDSGLGRHSTRSLCLTAFMGGLLLAYHTTNFFYLGVAFTPLWAKAWSDKRRGEKRSMGDRFFFLLFLSMGLSVLIYLPIRAAVSSSTIGFGEMVSDGGVWRIIAGKVYLDETPSFVTSWKESLWNVVSAFSSIPHQFGFPLSLAGLAGVVLLGRGLPRHLLLLFFVLIANILFFSATRLATAEGYRFPSHLFLPTYLVSTMLIGVGLADAVKRLRRGRKMPGLLIPPLMVAVTMVYLCINYKTADASRAYRFYERGKRALSFLERDALLVCTNRGNVLFNLWYFKAIEGRWLDVKPLSIEPFLVRPLEDGLKGEVWKALKDQRKNPSAILGEWVALKIDVMPVYSNLTGGAFEESYVKIPKGTLYRVQRTADAGEVWVEHPQIITSVSVNYEGSVEFLGFNLEPPRFRVGDTLRLTYFWKALRETRMDYQVAVLVTDGDGHVVASPFSEPLFHHLAYGAYTSQDWPKGRVVRESYELILLRHLSPGKYDLHLGLGDGRQLFPVARSGVPVDGRLARIGHFTVLP